MCYLDDHPRYDTQSSWNRATSYARCIKISFLEELRPVSEIAYEVIEDADDLQYNSGFWEPLEEFAQGYHFSWQIGQNGRSGGYLVLYQGGQKSTGHYSWCPLCGQRNFTRVLEITPGMAPLILLEHLAASNLPIEKIWSRYAYVARRIPQSLAQRSILDIRLRIQNHTWPRVTLDNRCGKCGKYSRVNYAKPPLERYISHTAVDMEEGNFDEWSLERLRERTSLVWTFDKAVDQAIKNFTAYCLDIQRSRIRHAKRKAKV